MTRMARLLILGLAVASLATLTACRGPQGPTGPTGPTGTTGPTGPDGPGTQTTYVFGVTPTSSSGTATANCPVVQADDTSGVYSTVSCYLNFPGYTDSPLVPFTDTETDLTTTSYFYSIEAGTVILGWINSVSTVPGPFNLVVTVVNP